MKRRVILNVLLFVCAVGLGVGLSLEPWRVYLRQKAETTKLTKEMQDAEERRAADLRRASEVESPAGRERTARERGYRKPGEVLLEGVR